MFPHRWSPQREPKRSQRRDLGPVSRKSRKLFGPEKPFIKLRLAYSVKLVFSYVVKGIKIKITAKFRASRPLTFEDTKRIMSPEMRPKSFGTFEKQAPDQLYCTIISWLRGFSPVHCLPAQVYKIHRYGGNVILVGFISFGLRPAVIWSREG